MATLLKSAMNFNFRSDILSVVVQCMNSSCEEVSKSCCSAVCEVFRKDRQGDISLDAVKMISNMVKNRDFKGVKVGVIQSFSSLPLRVHQDEAEAAKLHEKANKKKRKRDREKAQIEDELKDASGTVDLTLLAKMQAETLHAITLTYFRILKSHGAGKNALHLLPVALEGLAKFSHLINIDTVEDLLEHLKGLLATVDELPLDASLNCILTSFSTLQGPGRELKIDQKEYVAPLYSQLSRICSSSTIQHTNLVLRCLNLAFLKRREFSNTRVAAFIKKLLTVAVHAPPYCSASMIAFARLLFHRYQGTHQLLENELDVVSSGKYSPFTEDPDYSNPFAAAAWELSALKFHIQPVVSKHAANASLLKNLQLPAESPDNVYKTMLNNTNNVYIPFKLSKKNHPLRASKQKSAKRQRQEYRFITPRETKSWHLKDF
uniref:CCAAT-binding factor domain-containing protein n=1 Tax=Leptocylindrus danicus TaxID=163516 RepID=A0A7S2PRS0_9STRA